VRPKPLETSLLGLMTLMIFFIDTIVSPEFENRAIGELPVVELPPELDSKVL